MTAFEGNHVRYVLHGSRALTALLLLLCVAHPASAEIFKCTAKDGTALYQNFPCQFDSIATMLATGQSPPTATAVVDTRHRARKAVPVPVAPTVAANGAREVRVGMTVENVRAILGEPLEAVQDEQGEAHVETWRYLDRTIQFDRAQRVLHIEAWGG